MALAFVLGTIFAVGHHLFYNHLNGQKTPDVQYHLLVSLTGQQINLAVGAIFVALVKTSYGLATSTAHEQTAWRTIRNPNKRTKLATVDGLLRATSDAVVLGHPSLWKRSVLSMALAALSWLLAIAFILPASTLTVQSLANPSSSLQRVPQVDFLSLNFANVDKVISLSPDYRYDGPQYAVQAAVAGTMTESQILPIPPPHRNASWLLDFVGPALSCDYVDAELHANITDSILSTMRNRECDMTYAYLSWTSTYSDQDPLPFAGNSCAINSPSRGLGPIDTGKPLSLYVAALPNMQNALQATGQNQTIQVANMTVVGCTLQNVSYAANFSYVDGAQTVLVERREVYNNVTFLNGVAGVVFLNAYENGAVIPDQFNTSMVANFAYEAVMNAFNTFILGGIGVEQARNILINTSMATTALINTKELSFLYNNNISDSSYMPTSLVGLPSSDWNGLSVVQDKNYSNAMVDVLETMFTNATVSLMSSAVLNPNYSSPYAPGLVNVTNTPYYNTYVYSSAILWISYGVATAFTLFSICCGIWSVLVQKATYTTKFSTILRMSETLQLSAPLLPKDTGGEDPTPDDVGNMEVLFPKTNKTYEALAPTQEEVVEKGPGRVSGQRSDESSVAV